MSRLNVPGLLRIVATSARRGRSPPGDVLSVGEQLAATIATLQAAERQNVRSRRVCLVKS